MRFSRCIMPCVLIWVLMLSLVGTCFSQTEHTGSVTIEGNLTIRGNLTVTGDLTVGGRIIRDGDSNGTITAQTPEAFLVKLWNLDQQHNGLSVTLRDTSGAWQDESAAIRLDEQGAFRGLNNDGAPEPLMTIQDDSKLSGPTYQAIRKLFDNYVIHENSSEDQLGANPAEDQEIDDFLNAVLNTQVMENALAFINQQDLTSDGRDLTQAEFKALLKRQWFELYSNHFGDNVKHHISGFEHVFVGDLSGSDRIGGHHFWWKFFLDQEAGQADSLGHNYGAPPGEQYRWMATFRMRWEPEPGRVLTKPDKKGFFVGPSPELMLAYGTIGLLVEQKTGEHLRINFDGGRYELVLHASTLEGAGPADARRGDQIRSVFPGLLSLVVDPGPSITVAQALATATGETVRVTGIITAAHNNQFGLRLADALNSPEFLAVKLPQAFRGRFNPEMNPSVVGQKVTITGRRDRYTNLEGLVSVGDIQPAE